MNKEDLYVINDMVMVSEMAKVRFVGGAGVITTSYLFVLFMKHASFNYG